MPTILNGTWIHRSFRNDLAQEPDGTMGPWILVKPD